MLGITYTGYASIATTYDEFDRPSGVTYTFAGQEKSMSFTYGESGQKGTTVLISGVTSATQQNRPLVFSVALSFWKMTMIISDYTPF